MGYFVNALKRIYDTFTGVTAPTVSAQPIEPSTSLADRIIREPKRHRRQATTQTTIGNLSGAHSRKLVTQGAEPTPSVPDMDIRTLRNGKVRNFTQTTTNTRKPQGVQEDEATPASTGADKLSKRRRIARSDQRSNDHRSSQPRECIVCTEIKPVDAFALATQLHDGAGDAERNTCSQCWDRYVQSQLETISPDRLRCIYCPVLQNEADVRRLVTADTYQKYLDKFAEQAMLRLPGYRPCPGVDCPDGFVVGDDQIGYTCPTCEETFCAFCNKPLHFGRPCDRSNGQEQESEGEQVLAYADQILPTKGVKQCPECREGIQKNGGCDHTTCPRCYHELCWHCLAPHGGRFGVDGQPHMHRLECPYHITDPASDGYPLSDMLLKFNRANRTTGR